MLVVLDMSQVLLREDTKAIANGLKKSNVRLRTALFKENEMMSDGAEALAEYFG